MGEYQVIARKWRPQCFSDVVGQEHIVQTLRNAIKQKRTAHAYLFVGPRGIGKTTTARIFAKAMNCEAPNDGEPCCKCRSCLAIAAENSIDIIEIDAASQNSVDNIRDLRDEVMHVPVNSKYKIYIIDEVHMLSKQAWNALLKTIEEPPAHAKFIFATTEVHMVLPTIISRCQRFDLQRISTPMIAERLHKIAAAEKVNISNGAISAIARAADGGMRDAQSLLDQMIAFFSSDSNSDITEEQALSLFGLTSAAELQDFIKAMLTNNRGGVVYAVHQLAVKGKNLETLFNDTLVWLRGIQLCALLDDPENVLEIDKETSARFKSFGSLANQEIVQTLLETLSPVGRILHDALNKQVFLETIILKAMREAHAIKIEQLIERLNVIRKSGELEIIEKIPAVEPAYKYAVNPPPAVQTTVHEAAAPVFAVPPAPAVVHAPAVPAAPAVPVEPPPPAVSPLPPLAPESPSLIELEPDEIVPELIPADREDLVDSADLEDDDFTAPVSTMALVEDKPVAASPANVDNTKESREIWHRVIEAAEGDRRLDPVIYGYMREAAEVKLADNLLTVFYDEEFEPEHIAAVTKNITHLCRYLQRVLSVPDAEVKIELQQGIHAASGEKSVKSIMNEKTVNKVKNNPQVKVIVDLFDGEIVDIHG